MMIDIDTAKTTRAEAGRVGLRRQLRRLRSAVRRALDVPDRLGHERRRTRLEGELLQLPRTESVVFVCHGNICRSPYAAARFRELLGQRGIETIDVRSAGVAGRNGEAPPTHAIAAARRREIDMRRHRAARFDTTQHRADIVVVMEQEHRREVLAALGADVDRTLVLALGHLDPQPRQLDAIRDPYGHSAEYFDDCFERIDRCVERLADLIVRTENDGAAAPRQG